MYLPNLLASVVSVIALASFAIADLGITADNYSFGGVNFPQLQFLEPKYRDRVIRSIVKSNARVIRLFSKLNFPKVCGLYNANHDVVRGDLDHNDV